MQLRAVCVGFASKCDLLFRGMFDLGDPGILQSIDIRNAGIYRSLTVCEPFGRSFSWFLPMPLMQTSLDLSAGSGRQRP